MKFERIIWAMVVGALIALLSFRECTRPKPCTTGRTKIDTGWVTITDTIPDKPVPVSVVPRKKSPTSSPVLVDATPAHTCPADYYTENNTCDDTAFYNQTYRHQYGTINLVDTLTNNRITGRAVLPSFTIPVVTITDTVEKKIPVNRFQLYVGIGAAGNQLTQGIGPSVLIKTKKDQAFTAGAYYTRNGWLYNATIYKKISFNFLKRKQ